MAIKISKITLILFLVITIFCILFVRIIPDYSNDYGYKIITLNDYKKYKQGYCLKEDRILSKDELYKRAVKNYLLTVREEAEYPKYYNYMEKKYSYRDICTGGYCHFYKFNAKNLDELNKLIISAGEIDQYEFLRKYGKIFEPKDAQILDKDGKLMHTIIFNNEKNMYKGE